LVDGRAAANPRRNDKGQQKKRSDSQQPEKQRAHCHPMSAALSTCLRDMRQVSAQHVRASAKRFVGLVYGIASQNHGVAADSRLRVDNRISHDHGSVTPYLAADIQAPKENEDVSRQITLYLHRTEEAGSVMHLLACSNEDVLPHIRAVPWGLAECSGDQQKRQNETTQSACPQNDPLKIKPLT
jgi:hypothetical protein